MALEWSGGKVWRLEECILLGEEEASQMRIDHDAACKMNKEKELPLSDEVECKL